jgi:putative ABC transport system permease protein
MLVAAFRMSFRAIARSKVRAALTTLGILIGVAAVVVVVALGGAVRDQVGKQIETLGANTIFIFPQDTRNSGAKTQPRARLTEADAKAILDEATSVSAVTPQSSTRAQVLAGDKNVSTQVFGIGPDYFAVMAYELREGARFTQVDYRTKTKVVILGATVSGTSTAPETPSESTFESGSTRSASWASSPRRASPRSGTIKTTRSSSPSARSARGSCRPARAASS